MAKANPLIELRSTAPHPDPVRAAKGDTTGYKYHTSFNPKSLNMQAKGGKLKLRKYDPVVKKHVMFEQGKISRG
jgi:ribosomal protein L33